MRIFAILATGLALTACDSMGSSTGSSGSSGSSSAEAADPVCSTVETKAGTVETCA